MNEKGHVPTLGPSQLTPTRMHWAVSPRRRISEPQLSVFDVSPCNVVSRFWSTKEAPHMGCGCRRVRKMSKFLSMSLRVSTFCKVWDVESRAKALGKTLELNIQWIHYVEFLNDAKGAFKTG
jgi:hypothetical protein